MARSSPSRAAEPTRPQNLGMGSGPVPPRSPRRWRRAVFFVAWSAASAFWSWARAARLPGLVCAASGAASVVLSDLPEALPRLRRGIRQNNLANVVVKALDWRSGVCHPLFSDHNVEGRVTAYLGGCLPGVSRSWDAKRWLDDKPFDVVLCCDGVYKQASRTASWRPC